MKRLPPLIPAPTAAPFRLRLAEARDCELLRTWKNQNKRYFFHQDDITSDQQAAWFQTYLTREDDHVYVVEEAVDGVWIAIGLLGCRLLRDERTIDLYNVMRGARTAVGRTRMGDALTLLCAVVNSAYDLPLSCKVLANNPAIAWYQSLGFEIQTTNGAFVFMHLSKGRAR